MAMATAKTSKAPRVSPAQLARYFEIKLAAEVGPHGVKHLIDAGENKAVILDVRSREGYREGHIPGAVNIPLEELKSRWRELAKDRQVVSYCWTASCTLCTKASQLLAAQGYQAREMVGGIEAWKQAGFPVET